jgi:hypothetical protein
LTLGPAKSGLPEADLQVRMRCDLGLGPGSRRMEFNALARVISVQVTAKPFDRCHARGKRASSELPLSSAES